MIATPGVGGVLLLGGEFCAALQAGQFYGAAGSRVLVPGGSCSEHLPTSSTALVGEDLGVPENTM